ncbi:unnamed protein product [Adineta ricciae]|uniref:Uncharacterized protein n=1 Tax=Adineta ricciae TaxID=249248 RepID=A0A814Z3D4_ADIRI|nr:unnamed protein product [Adineta ricciae]
MSQFSCLSFVHAHYILMYNIKHKDQGSEFFSYVTDGEKLSIDYVKDGIVLQLKLYIDGELFVVGIKYENLFEDNNCRVKWQQHLSVNGAVTITAPFNDQNQLPDDVIDRFCYEIMPEIHHKIEWLDVEFSTMQRILYSADYPKLTGLGVYDLTWEAAKDLFDDESYFVSIFKDRILSLFITMSDYSKRKSSVQDVTEHIFIQTLTMFSNLRCLKFDRSFLYHRLTLHETLPNVYSSNLLELHVVLDSYLDCLYILDGRFDQLHTCCVSICSSSIGRLEKVINEFFSFRRAFLV